MSDQQRKREERYESGEEYCVRIRRSSPHGTLVEQPVYFVAPCKSTTGEIRKFLHEYERESLGLDLDESLGQCHNYDDDSILGNTYIHEAVFGCIVFDVKVWDEEDGESQVAVIPLTQPSDDLDMKNVKETLTRILGGIATRTAEMSEKTRRQSSDATAQEILDRLGRRAESEKKAHGLTPSTSDIAAIKDTLTRILGPTSDPIRNQKKDSRAAAYQRLIESISSKAQDGDQKEHYKRVMSIAQRALDRDRSQAVNKNESEDYHRLILTGFSHLLGDDSSEIQTLCKKAALDGDYKTLCEQMIRMVCASIGRIAPKMAGECDADIEETKKILEALNGSTLGKTEEYRVLNPLVRRGVSHLCSEDACKKKREEGKAKENKSTGPSDTITIHDDQGRAYVVSTASLVSQAKDLQQWTRDIDRLAREAVVAAFSSGPVPAPPRVSDTRHMINGTLMTQQEAEHKAIHDMKRADALRKLRQTPDIPPAASPAPAPTVPAAPSPLVSGPPVPAAPSPQTGTSTVPAAPSQHTTLVC